MKYLTLLFLTFYVGSSVCQNIEKDVEHIEVYHEKGKFGGWPANFGIWNWGNEILVGFAQGSYKNLGTERHNIDREKPEYHLLARSKDGGKTWAIEDPARDNNGALFVPDNGSYHGVARTDMQFQEIQKPSNINFSHPDFALSVKMTNGDGGKSFYWYSYNRGKTWRGPFQLPEFNGMGTAPRTDYLIDNKKTCTLFLTAPKSDGEEGRVICVRTKDGGKTWKFLSYIGTEPPIGYSIMPASVRLSESEILVTAREKRENASYISTYYSADNGKSWTEWKNAVKEAGIGNPPAMVKMMDGRICLIYGYRADVKSIESGEKTSDIRAKLSSDNGKTWSKDYLLRNDGSGRDVGYPRVIQRPDGKIVTVYYFMDQKTGPERYIGATIWDPPKP